MCEVEIEILEDLKKYLSKFSIGAHIRDHLCYKRGFSETIQPELFKTLLNER
jgi:hypothetical protein